KRSAGLVPYQGDKVSGPLQGSLHPRAVLALVGVVEVVAIGGQPWEHFAERLLRGPVPHHQGGFRIDACLPEQIVELDKATRRRQFPAHPLPPCAAIGRQHSSGASKSSTGIWSSQRRPPEGGLPRPFPGHCNG